MERSKRAKVTLTPSESIRHAVRLYTYKLNHISLKADAERLEKEALRLLENADDADAATRTFFRVVCEVAFKGGGGRAGLVVGMVDMPHYLDGDLRGMIMKIMEVLTVRDGMRANLFPDVSRATNARIVAPIVQFLRRWKVNKGEAPWTYTEHPSPILTAMSWLGDSRDEDSPDYDANYAWFWNEMKTRREGAIPPPSTSGAAGSFSNTPSPTPPTAPTAPAPSVDDPSRGQRIVRGMGRGEGVRLTWTDDDDEL